MSNPLPPVPGAISSDLYICKRFIGYDDYPQCGDKHDIYWVLQSCDWDPIIKQDCRDLGHCMCCLACEAERKREEDYIRMYLDP